MVKPFMYEKKNIESIQYTLYVIGLGITKLFAPFFPDITEEIYHQQYKQFGEQESIHITSWPEPLFIDEQAEKTGEFVKNIISAIRNWKSKKGIPLNQEIGSVEIFTKNKSILQETLEDIMKTLNIKQLKLEKSTSDLKEDISNIKPVYASIGKKFKKKVKHIIKKIELMNPQEVYDALEEKNALNIKLEDDEVVTLKKEDLLFEKTFSIHGKQVDMLKVDNALVAIAK